MSRTQQVFSLWYFSNWSDFPVSTDGKKRKENSQFQFKQSRIYTCKCAKINKLMPWWYYDGCLFPNKLRWIGFNFSYAVHYGSLSHKLQNSVAEVGKTKSEGRLEMKCCRWSWGSGKWGKRDVIKGSSLVGFLGTLCVHHARLLHGVYTWTRAMVQSNTESITPY